MKEHFKWGIYLGLAVSAGTQILTWLGLGLTNWFVALTYFLVIVVVAVSSKNLKSKSAGKLSFGQAILSVIVIIFISRVIFQIYMYFYVFHLDPGWLDMVSDQWEEMLRSRDMAEQQIRVTLDGFRKSYEPARMFTIEIIKYGIPQVILGSIVASFFILKGRPK